MFLAVVRVPGTAVQRWQQVYALIREHLLKWQEEGYVLDMEITAGSSDLARQQQQRELLNRSLNNSMQNSNKTTARQKSREEKEEEEEEEAYVALPTEDILAHVAQTLQVLQVVFFFRFFVLLFFGPIYRLVD